jgi:hypothetical protein
MTDDKTALIAAYQELSKSYYASADIRTKLVGIVPVATGVVIALLFNSSFDYPQRIEAFLLIGLLGVTSTLGIYFYDYCQVRLICRFIALGQRAETELGIKGHFTHRDIYGVQPTFVFYSLVAALWAYIALYKLDLNLARGAAFLTFTLSLVRGIYAYRRFNKRLNGNSGEFSAKP